MQIPTFRHARATRAMLCATLCAIPLSAQNPSLLTWEWHENVPTTVPTGVTKAAFAGGPVTGNNEQIAVLYGGRDSNGVPTSETWEWDGAGWWLNTNPATISFLADSAAALDPNALIAVLFGGRDGTNTVTAETWIYEFPPSQPFRQWTSTTPTTTPMARADHAMSPSGSGALMFGGAGQNGLLTDTWTWDHRGRTWVQISTAQAPTPRSGHKMAYDPARNRVVLFGGRDANGNVLGDTWEFDGQNWLPATPQFAPPARADHAMCSIIAAGQRLVLMHGGATGSGNLSDAWVYDGTTWWPLLNIGIGPRAGHGLVEMDNGFIATAFGGTSQGSTFERSTWSLEGYQPANPPIAPIVHRVAPGCSNTAFVPSQTTDDLPRQGMAIVPMTFDIKDLPLAPLPNSGLGVFVFGLVGAAMPCTPPFAPLQTDLQFVIPFAYTGDTAQVNYQIPTVPVLTGASLFHQTLAIAPNVAFGWVSSDLIRVRISQ